MSMTKHCLPCAFVAVAALVLPTGCTGETTSSGSGPGNSIVKLMKARSLTEADVSAALQTYTPTGRHDEYLTFASGGHGGNLIVIGVPSSTKLLRV